MRTARWMTVAPLLGVVTFVACDRGPDRSLAPDIVAPPSASGADVERFSTVAFTLIFDPERQLLAAHMPSDVFVCGGTEPLNVVDVLRVITPSTIGQRFAKQAAEERIAVYHAASPADAGLAAPINFFGFGNIVDGTAFCDFLQGPTRIAEGTVRRVSTFTLASFHGRWTGTLQGVDGQDYRFTEVYQLNADIRDPNDPATFTEPVVRIMLRPMP